MSKLTRNILHNMVGQSVLLILGFIAIRYVFRLMGEDALGIILFTLTLSNILTAVLEMGICSTMVREVSSHIEDEPRYIHELIRTASLFYWTAYVLLVLGILVFAPIVVGRWVRLESMDIATATEVVRVLGIGAVVSIPRALYMSLIRGLQRMELNNIIDVSTSVVQQMGIITVLINGGDLLSVAWWMSLSFGLSVVAYIGVAQRWFPWRAFVPGYRTAVVRRNFDYSSRMTWISLLSMVQLQADKLIVSKLLPLGFFGYYSFAYSTVSKGGALITGAIVQAAFPALSSSFRARGPSGMMSQYRKLQELVLFGTIPLFAGIAFAALPVLSVVFSPTVARLLLYPIVLLALGFYMNGVMNIPYVFSLAVGKPEISAKANLIALFLVLPATWLLIRHFGLNGAAFSWVFYHLFAYAYTIPRICRECLNIPVRSWYWQFLRVLAVAMSTYGVAGVVVKASGNYEVFWLALAFATATLVYGAVAFLMTGVELRGSLAAAIGQTRE